MGGGHLRGAAVPQRDKGFEQFQYGYASAMMLVAFLGCLALALLQYLVVRRRRLGLTGRSG